MKDECCGNCKFCHDPYPEVEQNFQYHPKCRKNAPVLLPTAMSPGYYGTQPSIERDYWCGDFKAKQESEVPK